MTGKVLAIHGNLVELGVSDGTIDEVNIALLGNNVQVGDVYEIYGNGDGSSRYVKVAAGNSLDYEAAVIAGKKPVNKIAYALLALFLGGLGIHKFYAGRTFMGIMFLLFCWTGIPAIIGFIQGILALTKTSDVYGNIYV